MAWVYLIVAGIFEWGWPVGLKLGLADTGLRWTWIAFAAVCIAVSGALLLIAQKTIPMGTALCGLDRHRRGGNLHPRHFYLQ